MEKQNSSKTELPTWAQSLADLISQHFFTNVPYLLDSSWALNVATIWTCRMAPSSHETFCERKGKAEEPQGSKALHAGSRLVKTGQHLARSYEIQVLGHAVLGIP